MAKKKIKKKISSLLKRKTKKPASKKPKAKVKKVVKKPVKKAKLGAKPQKQRAKQSPKKPKTIKEDKPKVNPVKRKPTTKAVIERPIKVGKPAKAAKPKSSKIDFVPRVLTEIDKSVEKARAELNSEFYIKIENVVSFAVLGVDIQLERLVAEVENTEYEPEQFPGLVYRTTNPRAAALIFSSGKIVCTGAKSIDSSLIAMNKVADTLRGIGIPVPQKFPIEIENIVASSKIDAKLNLEEIAFMLENAEYEPEQFPGLVYRITEPRVAFLLFSSGKIIITGGRSIVDVFRALAKFKEKLEEIGIQVKPAKD